MYLWKTQTTKQILGHFQTLEKGLDAEQVRRNGEQYGKNVFPKVQPDSYALIFLRQFQSPLIYVLLCACVVIYLLQDITDALILLVVLFSNAVVGTVQEGKAQNVLASLSNFMETKAVVFREGSEKIVSDTEIVPGDIVILREGDKVPADMRLLQSTGLTINESALTGESQSVYKTDEDTATGELPITEQKNMAFRGTHVAAGWAKALVVAVGTQTYIGSVTEKIASIHSEDPLQRDIRKLSRFILVAVTIICTTLFTVGIISGISPRETFVTMVSLAVSIIPEGLPLVLTLILVLGVKRMSKRNALVKRLQAVEALGQTSVIAVDKTGTITKNELVVREVCMDFLVFSIRGDGYDPRGDISVSDGTEAVDHPGFLRLAKLSAASNEAHVVFDPDQKSWQVIGDPTEAALVVLGEKLGFQKDDLAWDMKQLDEIPFSYQTRFHAVLHKTPEETLLTVVGAPEKVLQRCVSQWHKKGKSPLSEKQKAALAHRITEMSERGLRVLAIATRSVKKESLKLSDAEELELLGLIGMQDTLRTEVHDALSRAHSAGIRVVMITGDHRLTAQAIAREAGIFHPGDTTLTGEDLDLLSDQELGDALSQTSVFARVTPEHKMRIIQAYQARGETIAMTGDGVNDAPSLLAADLGVAMGKIGTEVAKEAGDIILLDDNFGSIISAAEEGRSIYRTIKKVILYLFSTSLGEVLTITGALLLGWPLPIAATQILWLNFVTDGFLNIPLALEPKEKGLMSKNFMAKQEMSLVDRRMLRRMIGMALPMALGTLWIFSSYVDDMDLAKGWTITLTFLAACQWFNALNCRSEKDSITQNSVFSNRYFPPALVFVLFLQLLAIYHPFFQEILHTTPLSPSEWLTIFPLAATILIPDELMKWWERNKANLSFRAWKE